MADERENSRRDHGPGPDQVQTAGREQNEARLMTAGGDHGGPERYPAVRQDDAVEATGHIEEVPGERRSFDPSADAPTPRRVGAEGELPASANEGRLGPGGDPAEGKR